VISDKSGSQPTKQVLSHDFLQIPPQLAMESIDVGAKKASEIPNPKFHVANSRRSLNNKQHGWR